MNQTILFIFLLLNLSFYSSIIIQEINQIVFLNPQTNTAVIQCPVNSLDIQWYDGTKHYRGKYYHIIGLQSTDRELICSNAAKNEEYKFKIRTYDRPLPIRYISIPEITSTSLTVSWKDDSYNQNANISSYELILKYNNTIQNHILVNKTLTSHTFLSLYPNTFYTIEIKGIDIWKRSSRSKTINSTTKILSHQIIDRNLLDQSISCYHLNRELLLIQLNRSKFEKLNYIYKLIIYDKKNSIILTDELYSNQQKLPRMKTLNSFIYFIKEDNLKLKIKLILSTIQSEFLGVIEKHCENFYPIYSPLTCSIKSIDQNKYQLMISMQLFNHNKQLFTLKPNYIFYQTNQKEIIKKDIYKIHKYITTDIIDPKENYSVIVENNLIGSATNEKINISIICSNTGTVSANSNSKLLNVGIIGVVLLIFSFLGLLLCIGYTKGLMPNCRHVLIHYIYSFRKNHRSTSNLMQINDSTNENLVNKLDINYKFDSLSIPIDEFASYVSNMHKDNDFGFIRLFESISESTRTYTFPSAVSQIEFNKTKNRYINILTYDHSRVKLSNDENANYINANYIDGYEKTNAYIATQGPMANTINDFWRMIWEKDVNVIVMITNIKESGRVKCDMYWPYEDTEMYGNIEVTLIKTISLAYYVKRTFAIRCRSNEKFIDYERLVYQFHYTDWPDHGVPLYTFPVLNFVRQSSACNSETGGHPIVVHCSAGVGRTGTYIVIDTMLKKISEHQPLNIPSFIKHIRQQRNYLVQTEEQFIFIYDVLLEVIQLLNIGCNHIELNLQNRNSDLKLIEKQFQLIRNQMNTYDFQLLIEENSSKNRTTDVLPVSLSRVFLSTDSRYINASYLHGYYRVNEFIITQHPMKNTIIDFWQMIWDTNTNIIVSLYADEKSQSNVPDFWPSADQILDCGNFTLCLLNEYFEYEYIYRDILLQSTKNNMKFQVKIISTTYWPETCSPLRTVFNLISVVENLNSDQPIVVHDLYGGHRAATFCALYTMNEQIKMEGILNVYELAKFYYLKRPGIWRNSDDLVFLYRCADILFQFNFNRQYL